MDRLFLDTNVLLDVLEKRAPWFPESTECLARVRNHVCKGAVTALTLSDIAYIQKTASTEKLYATFRLLREFIEIANLDAVAVDKTMTDQLEDLEDGLQLSAALGWKATHLITRNTKDFPSHPLLVIQTPAEYLRSIAESGRSSP